MLETTRLSSKLAPEILGFFVTLCGQPLAIREANWNRLTFFNDHHEQPLKQVKAQNSSATN